MKATHPIWSVLSVVVMLVVLGGCLALGYDSRFDEFKDTRTLVVVVISTAVVEAIRKMTTS